MRSASTCSSPITTCPATNCLPRARSSIRTSRAARFPSKCIAGVGVMFYVLLALRAELRRRGAFNDARPEPRLDGLLDLVALGTVADVVKLDRNNRMLVAQGLQRIRTGRMQPGIAALFRAAARDARSRLGLRSRLCARAAAERGGTALGHVARASNA